MANEETFIQEELLKLGLKKKLGESVLFTAHLLPPHHQNLQLISSALSGGVAKTQSFLLPQLPIKKYSFLPTGAGHQHFSYLPTLNLVKEAKFRWM